MHLAERYGFEVRSTDDSSAAWREALVTRLTFRLLRCHLHHLWHNRRNLAAADIVWAMSERELIAALLGDLVTGGRRLICGETVWLLDEWPRYGWPRRLFLRWLLRRTDRVLVTSEASRAALAELLPELSFERTRFGVPFEAYRDLHPDPVSAAGARPARPLRLLALGFDHRRDWATLFQAIRDLDGVELTVLSPYPATRRLAEGLGNVTVLDEKGYAATRPHYARADAVVVPLVPVRQPVGLTVLLEAVAAGLPVIFSRTGAVQEFFPEDCLTLVPPQDPAALRAAILELVRDPVAAAEKAVRARAHAIAQGYDAASAVEDRCRIMLRLLGDRRGAALRALPRAA
jgi:glycosyltransferase involved in cell wall biosynthesis